VDLSFADAQLAALCNSRQQITSRWGHEGFTAVSRRLAELFAVDGADVVKLPMTTITDGDDGIITIECDRGVVTITAVPFDRKEPTHDLARANRLHIMTVDYDHQS
jgi:hypothetical protein